MFTFVHTTKSKCIKCKIQNLHCVSLGISMDIAISFVTGRLDKEFVSVFSDCRFSGDQLIIEFRQRTWQTGFGLFGGRL